MEPRLYSATGNILWVMEISHLESVMLADYADVAQTLCQKGGADGVMLLNAERLELWIINSDGSNGGFCGNGVRAVGFYLQETRGLKAVQVSMGGHLIDLTLQGETVCFTLASPQVDIQSSPEGYRLAVPNPHLVILNPPETWTLEHEGKSYCKDFNTNVEFVYPEADHIRVLVYERGVGPTAACGSGAIAVFKVLQKLGQIQEVACIRMPGGDLTLRESGDRLSSSGLVKALSCI
jgi:diaminopimelate epimerase